MDYIVANENTLGYIVGKAPQRSRGVSMVVLAVAYMAGGDPLLIGHRVYMLKDKIREAIPADEEKFLVRIFN